MKVHVTLALSFMLVTCKPIMGQEDLRSRSNAAILNPVCLQTDETITVTIGDRPFFTYHKATVEPPAGIDSIYRRSGYIHPIQTPSGRIVTGDFAPDHAHQHGFFMAWVNTEFAGHEIDFWNQPDNTGRISHASVVQVDGANDGSFEVELIHEDITTPDDPVQVLSERWKVRAVDQGTHGPFVFDFESRQKCVADLPLTLRKYIYGGLGLRGNEQWFKPNQTSALQQWEQETERAKNDDSTAGSELPSPPGIEIMGHDFLTSENNRRHNGNETLARWTTIYGPVSGAMAGLAVLSHPENFRSPQPVRLHPAMPYFSFAPIIAGEFQIKPDQTYTTRFRVVAYDGEPDRIMLEQLWNEFSNE